MFFVSLVFLPTFDPGQSRGHREGEYAQNGRLSHVQTVFTLLINGQMKIVKARSVNSTFCFETSEEGDRAPGQPSTDAAGSPVTGKWLAPSDGRVPQDMPTCKIKTGYYTFRSEWAHLFLRTTRMGASCGVCRFLDTPSRSD